MLAFYLPQYIYNTVLINISSCVNYLTSKALLNVGEMEKPADPADKQPPQTTAGSCGCNKSCDCTKAAVVFSDLYSTGTNTHTAGSLITARCVSGAKGFIYIQSRNKIYY